jgi:Fe-coproporphyrin III synthase
VKIRPYASLARRIVVSNFRRLSFPYKLTYAVTNRCNYRCATCNIWQKDPSGELTTAEIRNFFSKSNDFSWIDLTGGEIFLRQDLLEIAETILTNCRTLLLLHFPTNGNMTERIVRTVSEIVTFRPEKLIITVSMDGDEVVNDRLRGVPGGWRKQIETFRRLHAMAGLKVVLGMTLSADNAGEFSRAFEAAKKECDWLSYDDFHVNIAHSSPHFYGNAECDLYRGDEAKVIETVNEYLNHRRFPLHPVAYLEHEYLKRVEKYLKTHKTPIACHALRASCFMNPEGVVFPCSIYDRPLGNIREFDYDLRAIWNAESTRTVQREIWQFDCPHCWTPCEAYQSILGKVLRRKRTPGPKKGDTPE